MTLSGSNGYTGGTAVSGGLLSVSALNDTANSNIPNSTLNLSGGTLQYTGTGDITNRTVNTSNGAYLQILNPSADLTILGNVNTGPLNKTGSGTLTLGGNGDNSGLGLNVLQGTVIFAKVGPTSGHAVGGGGVTVSPGALLQLASSTDYGGQIYAGATINGTFDLNGRIEGVTGLLGTGLVTNNSSGTTSTLTFGYVPGGNLNGSSTFPGILSNGASGAGVLALAVSSGNTSVSTLTLTGTSNAYSGGTTIYNNGALVIGDGATSPGSLPGNVVISSSTANALTFNTPLGMSITASGNISGSGTGGLTKNGAGLATLSGSNNYAGQTTVNAGVLAFANTGTVPPGSGNIAISSGGVVTGGFSTIGGWLPNIAASSAGVLALNSADTETVSMAGLPQPGDWGQRHASFSGSFTPAGTPICLAAGVAH